MQMEQGSTAATAEKYEQSPVRHDPALLNFLIGLRSSGIRRSAVIAAFEETQRRFFLPHDMRPHAYAPFSLPIGCGEEATAPATIARVIVLADPGGSERVLEIGTGSGYQTALLSRICRSLVSVERWRSLSERAAKELRREGVRNVELQHADGLKFQGAEKFDLIIVNAALETLPAGLMELLKQGGRVVAPLRDGTGYSLTRVENVAGSPLVSHHGAIEMLPVRNGVSVTL